MKMILRKIALFCSLFLFLTTPLWANKDVALVLKVSGEAEVKKGNNSWQPLRRGTRLDGGNQIRTSDQSLVAVVFTDDKSLIKIRSNSEVTIHGAREKTGIAKKIDMGVGQLWAKVTPGGRDFRIETPTGVAAVKGTEFYVNLIDGLMEVIGVEGLVQLFNDQGSVNVGAGQRGVLQRGQAPAVEPAREVPDWGELSEDEKEIVIEFEDDEGNKKYLKLKFQ